MYYLKTALVTRFRLKKKVLVGIISIPLGHHLVGLGELPVGYYCIKGVQKHESGEAKS